MALTQEKAERIAQEYAKIDYKDKTTPLLALGYSQTYAQSLGHKLYSNIKVIKAIEDIKAVVSKKTGITIEWVVNNLREVAERCMNAVPVFDNDGKETGEWGFDAPGANKALQLLGLHVNAFEAGKTPMIDARTYNLTQLTAILEADKARVKEIDSIEEGIAE